ncbi:MAG: peptidylprolyl isomerase [Dehalococcoidia bacterium]|nr:peptidylprolyl isomerase [Dehalococcoidia bacterium]
MKRAALALSLMIAAAMVFSGCSKQTATTTPPTTTAAKTTTTVAATTTSLPSSTPAQTPTTTTGAATLKQYPAPPKMTIDKTKKYTATMHTSKGDIEISLFASEDPITVNNFVFLARDGFYNGVKFHRIMTGFMIQSGDPKGDGTGGPGYQFVNEPVTRKYVRGTIAMANAGLNTNGSQFFIMHKDYALQPNYTIFGIATKGLDVVDAIASTPVKASSTGEMSVPTQTVLVNSIDITEQ